jgi:photosystem II stability/assembly factor-like uncharacterized protein
VALLAAAALAWACAGPAPPAGARAPALEPLASGPDESLRGLSVVDDRVAWTSGTHGTVGRTVDGGGRWDWRRIPGFEERDLRAVTGFTARRALVVAVDSPGVILETVDGGATWAERWRDGRPGIFLDGLACAGPRRCLAFGDPIDGRFLLLASADGGRSWRSFEGPEAAAGEAAFAASDSALRLARDGRAVIGTGGPGARVLLSGDSGRTWSAAAVPLASGAASRGVFALVFAGRGGLVAVGGDYRAAEVRTGTAAFSADGGVSWSAAAAPPGGYRSGLERLADGTLIATGPDGTDESVDGGRTWRTLSAQGFHVVRRARRGGLVLLAGPDGRLARLAGGAPERPRGRGR